MKFRLLLKMTGLLIVIMQSVTAVAQTQQRFLRIRADYGRGDRHVEEAVEYIDAANRVGSEANVEYRAGKTVQLLPGFEARSGSVFLATVRPVFSEGEKTLHLSAFPNPFEHVTTIEYYLPADGKVDLWILDAQGVRVRQLIKDQSQAAGMHRIEWNADDAVPGVYLPVVESNQQRMTTRLVKK